MHFQTKILSIGLSASILAPATLADGVETLAAPEGVSMQAGTDVLLAGVGLRNVTEGTIELTVPDGATVLQVLAYWGGRDTAPGHGPIDTIELNGLLVEGVLSGGPSDIPGSQIASGFRADVTELGLIAPGDNAVVVTGFDYELETVGCGLAVIIDDGDESLDSTVEIRDGLDWAFHGFDAPYDATVRQDYTFEASDEDRSARFGLFCGSVSEDRPTIIEISIDGVVTEEIIDAIASADGRRWDSIDHEIVIPAGATSASIQVFSADSGAGPLAGGNPGSIAWFFNSFTLDTPAAGGGEGCKPYFWITNLGLWDGYGEEATQDIVFWQSFNQTMGVSFWRSGLPSSANLGHGIFFGSFFGFGKRWLNRSAATALANADSGMSYPFTVDEIVALYRDAVGADYGPETVWSALNALYEANLQFCPLATD